MTDVHGKQSEEQSIYEIKYSLFQVPEDQSSQSEVQSSHVAGKKPEDDEGTENIASNALTTYFRKGIGLKGIILLLILFLVAQTAVNSCEIWLSVWYVWFLMKFENFADFELTI